jgi:hypothetical protein
MKTLILKAGDARVALRGHQIQVVADLLRAAASSVYERTGKEHAEIDFDRHRIDVRNTSGRLRHSFTK